jgi:hypothetical protein
MRHAHAWFYAYEAFSWTRARREGGVKGVDTSRHFSYYAFDGGSGALRWKHEVGVACFGTSPPTTTAAPQI